MYSLLISSETEITLLKATRINTKFKNDWRFGSIEMKWHSEFEETVSTRGILRLFRSTSGIDGSTADTSIDTTAESKDSTIESKDTKHINKTPKEYMLLCLSVPMHIPPQDIVTLTINYEFSKMLILQDSIPQRYMILFTFSTLSTRDLFYENICGIRFHPFESDVCQLVFIDELYIQDDTIEFSIDLGVEIPTCPVCLDRMDSTASGLFTTLCQHTFHCHCIMRWSDSTCPVCRYCLSNNQASTITDGTVETIEETNTNTETNTETQCNMCPSKSHLWICLVCGHVGCARFLNQHSLAHYTETNHPFALELSTQRVWDYTQDTYIHRVIRHKDGDLISVGKSSGDVFVSEAIESMAKQYQSNLKSKIQETKKEYQSTIQVMETKNMDYVTMLAEQISIVDVERIQVVRERDVFAKKLKQVTTLNDTLTKKVNVLQQKLISVEKERKESECLYESIAMNLKQVKEQNATQKEEIAELKEQVRDLMFFIETLEKSTGELASASVVGVSPQKTRKGH
jgi:BRCA1-associated protein